MKLISDSGGVRLDAYLAQTLEQTTRSAAQRLIEDGAVLLNGAIPRKNTVLKEGDSITVTLPDLVEIDLIPQDIPLDVVYEDEDLIVVNKPVGMVVHPAPGHPDGTLVNALLYHCGSSLSGINGALRPGIVHRIDKDTGGLLIAAKNDFAHQHLAAQLQDHSLYRGYETIVYGGFREDEGTVNLPIGRNKTDRKKMAVDHRDGRSAITHWSVLARYNSYTHIGCRLETGRTHQIRVHMTAIGHPLVGDTVYGGAKKPAFGLVGQCLFARRLTFTHPRSGETVTLECPLPDWFAQVLTKLGNVLE